MVTEKNILKALLTSLNLKDSKAVASALDGIHTVLEVGASHFTENGAN
eukprot:CAMPEP_0202966250 /NCGR_PEP_ID=MMETSP1396-20130829/10582_1 /ASSEMBLY_ACC=CAM_ASM_000872 /TAXON_ID= /ORGANISM="Pseudokeronopsis sp., Strain Brazil" /LENGTH=47 /DNA_ID= /DNA_START= /DNA_END= /DNA_ORIENTATION=